MTSLNTAPAADTTSLPVAATSRVPAMLALVLGAFLFLGAGFAWPSAIHNAAHDTRHALGLPCH